MNFRRVWQTPHFSSWWGIPHLHPITATKTQNKYSERGSSTPRSLLLLLLWLIDATDDNGKLHLASGVGFGLESGWQRTDRQPLPTRAKLRLLAKQTVRLHLNIINGGERGSRLLCCDEGREGRPLWLGRLCKVCGWTTTCLFMCLGGNDTNSDDDVQKNVIFN